MPSPEQLAWCTGLFEGEGSVGIERSTQRRGRNRAWFSLVVTIAMTDPEPALLLAELFNGNVCYPRARRANTRAQAKWSVATRDAAGFLQAIEPYLICRRTKEKTRLALEFQGQKRRIGVADPLYTATQIYYFEAMREMNRRGDAAIFRLGIPIRGLSDRRREAQLRLPESDEDESVSA